MIHCDLMDDITATACNITLNQMFKLYMSGKTELKQSTRTNYNYIYKKYMYDTLGQRRITSIAKLKTYSHWLPLFTIFLGTGCRVGEIVGLQWEDCDFENQMISINHNLVYRQQDSGKCEFHVTTPKTNASVRIVPMLEEVRKELLQEREKQMAAGFNETAIDGYSGFVFTNRFGYIHNPMTINRAIKRIISDCNREEKLLAEKVKRKPLAIWVFSIIIYVIHFVPDFVRMKLT